MSAIRELDQSSSALRLLLTLYKIGKPLMLSDLYHEMRTRYGLGRRTVDTAIQTCMQLKLVKREVKRIGKNPMPSIFHELTSKGKKIAEIITQLEKTLH